MAIRYCKPAATALLAAWLCFSVAQFFWVLLARPLPNAGAVAPAAAVAETAQPPVDLDALMLLSFAGTAGNAPQAYAQAAPQTSGLNLVLRGAIPSNDPAAAKAIIAEGERQRVFASGETLTLGPHGIKLVAVMPDRVTLDNNGRLETLWMYQQSAMDSARPLPDMTTKLSALPGLASVIDTIGNPPATAMAMAMASTLGSVASVSAQQDGGFRIRAKDSGKDSGRLFRRLGLRNDDVVTAINDVSLQDSGNALAMYRSLAGASRVKLAIVRNGEPVSVLVDLAALNK